MTNKFVRMIHELSDEELDSWESQMRADLSRARTISEQGGRLRNTSRIKTLRKNIARILTVKNERRNLR